MDAKPTILLADDDTEFTALLDEFLSGQGFAVRVVHDGGAAVEQAADVDAVVLDVMMPRIDGFEALRAIRAAGVATPVLMLTARGEDIDRIVGLEMGADDYLPKPANPRELAARLRAILRRLATQGGRDGAAALVVGQLRLEPASRTVSLAGQAVELTGLEFEVLQVLAARAGQVVDKDNVSREALGRRLLPHDRSIDMHISNLRAKLGHGLIKTVRGRGYQLVRA